MIRNLFTPADLIAAAFFVGVVFGLVAGFAFGVQYADQRLTAAHAVTVERAAEDRALLAVTVVTCEQWRERVEAYDEAAFTLSAWAD